MDKIDRLGWAAGISLVAYGLRIGVRTNEEEIMGRIVDLLPSGWKPSKTRNVEGLYSLRVGRNAGGRKVRQFHLLYAGLDRVSRSEDLEHVLESLKINLRHFVAENARNRIFVHAGVVGWKGKAILVPGKTFSGKSTLVAEFVRAGAQYYSDEYAVLDSRGMVHPYLKPISLREKGSAEQEEIDVHEFGGVAGSSPLPVGTVLITNYRANARWRPKRLSDGHGVLELLAHTVPARRRPELALATLTKVVSGAHILKGTRGDARQTVREILSPDQAP